ncbi:YoaK family protein [Permianibacter aggregans]|uniref:Uncharacterized membrane protein YoaK (UPF0700 family) n=1 Tax=Permianibacter aggregans TaxID=1510150 RepID=A0A4R6UE67_9GAMM|nr:YoaK family protein [Permianibacter aggregans]QGX39871.1 DUF1275 domain-containing protein [Permianibacter aggregans]TDQ43419.1 uncharacterized membrane protein YoaK (UPF0700 family) [Permianibacter aggregans]
MIRKLPRWVEIGGFCLALIAGAVNAIGLLGFAHQAVSHLTGTSTLLSVALFHQQWPQVLHLGLIVVFFVLGAVLSGALINNAVLQLGRRYAVALFVEAAMLLLAIPLLMDASPWGHWLASAACGLQNGMVSTYSGAVVRTTHVSGLFTDLGTMLGESLRGHVLDRRRALLYLILISGFLVGGIIGAAGFIDYGFNALAIPALAAALLAIIVLIWRHFSRQSLPAPRAPD